MNDMNLISVARGTYGPLGDSLMPDAGAASQRAPMAERRAEPLRPPLARSAIANATERPMPAGGTENRLGVLFNALRAAPSMPPADASAMLLSVLSAQVRGLQLDLTSAEDNISALQDRIKTQSQKIIAKIDEAAKAHADAQRADRLGFWLNIAADVVAIGFAGLLVVGSGGAAAPLAVLVVASLSAGYAAADIGLMTYGAATGQEMSMSSVVSSGVSDMCVKVFGCDKALADEIGMWTSMVLPLILSLGELGLAIAPKMAATTAARFPRLAQVFGQSGAGTNLNKLNAMSSTLFRGVTAVDAGVTAGNSVAGGVRTYFSNSADNADIDRQETDAHRTASRVEREQLVDHMKATLESIATNRDSVTSMLKDAHQMRIRAMAA